MLLDAAYAAYAPNGLDVPLAALESLLGRALVLVAWSASKTLTQYGLRVGALVALAPDAGERSRIQAALSYAGRGTWSNCNRGGMLAVARLLARARLAEEVRRDRKVLVDRLSRRVDLFNRDARTRGLRYPRYDGGFFVTIFDDDAFTAAEKMKGDGVFVGPPKRAPCGWPCAPWQRPTSARLVDSLAKACT